MVELHSILFHHCGLTTVLWLHESTKKHLSNCVVTTQAQKWKFVLSFWKILKFLKTYPDIGWVRAFFFFGISPLINRSESQPQIPLWQYECANIKTMTSRIYNSQSHFSEFVQYFKMRYRDFIYILSYENENKTGSYSEWKMKLENHRIQLGKPLHVYRLNDPLTKTKSK